MIRKKKSILLEYVLIALIGHFRRFLVDCKVNKITFFLIFAKIRNVTNSRKLMPAKICTPKIVKIEM